MAKILIIEDELKVLEVVTAYLEKENHEVIIATDGFSGIELFNKNHPDILVLDLMLPGISGEQICQHIRKHSNLPIIMLTARSSVEDRINGLALGADDYLIKPFSPKELVMRIHALLRRTSQIEPLSDILTFNYGDLVVDSTKYSVFKKGNLVNLTTIEYKLLSLFIRNPRKVFSREELINKALGMDYDGYDRTIDAHIKNIRKKIETDPKHPEYIKTVFGIGYKFEGEKNENSLE